MSPPPSAAATMALAVLFSSCVRYEWVPDYETEACRNRPPEPTFVVTRPHFIPSGSSSGDSLSGIISFGGSQKPAYSQVILGTAPSRTVMTDTLGHFTIWAPPGRYELFVRTIGHRATRDSVTLPPPGNSTLAITVDQRPIPTDGPCSGFASVRVSKPWWKVF